MGVFFNEGQAGKYEPNAIFIDIGPHVENLQSGAKSDFYRNCFVNGGQTAADTYAKARHSICGPCADDICDRIQTTLERCSNLQGLVFTTAAFTGVGSGLPAVILGLGLFLTD